MFEDLNERELRQLFVRPFEAAKDILTRGQLFRNEDISEVYIGRTNEPATAARKELQDESYRQVQEFNRNSSVVLISAGSGYKDYEIKDASEDVTGRFVLAAPQAGKASRLRALLYDPWFVRIGGGLMVAGLIALVAMLFR